MLDQMESVRSLCPEIAPEITNRHFECLPASYFERYSTVEIARHLRLLANLPTPDRVAVELRPLAAQVFEIVVVGIDHSGAVACITAALAAFGFDLQDVQVSTYLDTGAGTGSGPLPQYFVIVLRASGPLRGQSLAEWTIALQDRLRSAFAHLAEGNLMEAQSVAVDTRILNGEGSRITPHPAADLVGNRTEGHMGMLLGGDFRLLKRLATGGMSHIYLATQLSLNRTVVVKLFHQETVTNDELVARLNQEAQVLAQFTCPEIVPIHAAGTAQDRSGGMLAWMAMEYMAGGDLAGRLREQECLPVELCTRWLRQALEGLNYAHRRSVLHRDLKPHNLLLTSEGHLKVSDFGLLKRDRRDDPRLTPRSAILGTPHYMSPEQALGEPMDERSDIFSLGTTFFHLVSGRLPFEKETTTAMLLQIAHEDAPRLSEAATQVPLPLAVIIQRMMARRREERYQEVGVILEDLASYERRGLLKSIDSGCFVPPTPPPQSGLDEKTQAYRPKLHETKP